MPICTLCKKLLDASHRVFLCAANPKTGDVTTKNAHQACAEQDGWMESQANAPDTDQRAWLKPRLTAPQAEAALAYVAKKLRTAQRMLRRLPDPDVHEQETTVKSVKALIADARTRAENPNGV